MRLEQRKQAIPAQRLREEENKMIDVVHKCLADVIYIPDKNHSLIVTWKDLDEEMTNRQHGSSPEKHYNWEIEFFSEREGAVIAVVCTLEESQKAVECEIA